MKSQLPIRALYGWPFQVVVYLVVVAVVLTSLPACSGPQPAADETVDQDRSTPLEKICILIVGDDQIGSVITRQWSAHREGELEIRNLSFSEFVSNGCELDSGVDVVIYPPGLLGELATKEQIAEIPSSVWNDEENLNKKEILRHARSTLVSFSKKVWAVPLGSPSLVMLYRSDVLKKLNLNPPATWEEFDNLIAKLTETQSLTDDQGHELPTEIGIPLSDQWCATMFLARVAPYIRYRGKLSTVFDRNDMEPLVASEPFIEALKEMKAAFQSSPASWQNAREVYADMIAGKTAVAISWPAPIRDGTSEQAMTNPSVEIARIPGAHRWFDAGGNGWTERSPSESIHVDLLAFDGFVASINSKSGRSLTSQEFLRWLPSKSISLATLAGSPHSGPFRASHLGNSTLWSGNGISQEAAAQYSDIIREINEQSVVFMFPRIPGQVEYLEILNAAVADCLAGKIEPEAALKTVAEQWKQITEKYGATPQRANLRRGEGI
jgi:ABC-type glycerol-3-phosphate transport system substrate-binding protein